MSYSPTFMERCDKLTERNPLAADLERRIGNREQTTEEVIQNAGVPSQVCLHVGTKDGDVMIDFGQEMRAMCIPL